MRESFVFPKQVAATAHTAEVPARDHLLDYEIELGFVALAPIARGGTPRHMGLVLASDYTDRAALLRHVRMTDVASGAGFTTGKSAPGFMPVGNLLVILADLETFVAGLRLTLAHNSVLRQDAQPSRMVWKLPRMLEETFAREAMRWDWNGRAVALPVENGIIAARTLILSGTPDGVLYRKPSSWQLTRGVFETVVTLNWLSPNRILEPHIRDEVAARRYLQPGDVVEMRADRLGTIRNRIVP